MPLDVSSIHPVVCDRCKTRPHGDRKKEIVARAWRNGWRIIRELYAMTVQQEVVLCPACAAEVDLLRGNR